MSFSELVDWVSWLVNNIYMRVSTWKICFCTTIFHVRRLGSGLYQVLSCQVPDEIQGLKMRLFSGYMQRQRAGDMSAGKGRSKFAETSSYAADHFPALLETIMLYCRQRSMDCDSGD